MGSRIITLNLYCNLVNFYRDNKLPDVMFTNTWAYIPNSNIKMYNLLDGTSYELSEDELLINIYDKIIEAIKCIQI